MNASPDRKALLAVLVIIVALALIYSGKRRRLNSEFDRTHPLTAAARQIGASRNREWCDDQVAKRRLYVSEVMDRYHPKIAGLWRQREQKPGKEVPTIALGPIRLRVSETKSAPTGLEFEDSSWSWEEAYGSLRKTQDGLLSENELKETWRDVDAMTSFLLQKDYGRVMAGKKFLAPELTEQLFRPNAAVERTGKLEFTVKLDSGSFGAYESTLAQLIEKEWRGGSHRVRVRWVKNDPAAYRLEPNLESGRSFVNHQRKAIVLENLAWTKTLAHEFGHVLGFEDHYYVVWNPTGCYYRQLSRFGDLMSNSQSGHVSKRHWEILEQAYPPKAALRPAFTYLFQPEKPLHHGQGNNVGGLGR